jgi:hypothetical protein
MTPRQARIFDTIRDHIERIGLAPTLEEIGAATGIASKSNLSVQIGVLVKLGLLRRTAASRRNLALADSVDLRPVPTAALQAELARRGVTTEALDDAPAAAAWNRQSPLALSRHARCAADGCDGGVRPGWLMCRAHWHSLPHDLQREIFRTYEAARRLQRSRPRWDGERQDAEQAYLAAVQQARDVAGSAG